MDAVQSFGRLSVDVDQLNADLVSVSAHKINGPAGAGALYVRRGMALEALLHGGGQEHGCGPGHASRVQQVNGERAHAGQTRGDPENRGPFGGRDGRDRARLLGCVGR